MSDTTNGNKSNRDHSRYDLPELPPRRSLRHDGITAPADNSPSSERGGEYQVGSNNPKTSTSSVDPHSFAAAGGFSATF